MFFAAIIFVLSIFRFMLSLSILSLFNTNFSKFWDIFRPESMTFAFFAFFALCAALLAWLTYQFSIEKIYEWGSLVKAAFDCYLPDLAKRLGYELPLTGDDQKKFWISISRRASFIELLSPKNGHVRMIQIKVRNAKRLIRRQAQKMSVRKAGRRPTTLRTSLWKMRKQRFLSNYRSSYFARTSYP